MIRKSFIFLKGISYKKEKLLWKQGILDWNEFLNKDFKGIKKEKYIKEIQKAKTNLLNQNSSYFTILPKKEIWRLYDYFRNETFFIDIEVDSNRNIIALGLYNGQETKVMIKNLNLDFKELKNQLKNCKLLVTFNGWSFDLPLIKKYLPINIPHIDLKYCCQKLGLIGGLKEVEKQLNIIRPKNLRGHPVDLWKAYHASHDPEYLELLIKYNEEDIINLKWILEYCYKQLSQISL